MQLTQFFIGHGLHLRNACSWLATAYTHAFLISGNHFVDFYLHPDVLSTTSMGFIAGQGDILQYKGIFFFFFFYYTISF